MRRMERGACGEPIRNNHTWSLSASGAVHLIGDLSFSKFKFASRVYANLLTCHEKEIFNRMKQNNDSRTEKKDCI